jgi:hypothetical protein
MVNNQFFAGGSSQLHTSFFADGVTDGGWHGAPPHLTLARGARSGILTLSV